jgi:hypothetical protein
LIESGSGTRVGPSDNMRTRMRRQINLNNAEKEASISNRRGSVRGTRRGVDRSFVWAVLLCLCGAFWLFQHYDQSAEAPLERKSPQRVVSHERDVESWENCTVSFVPPPRKPKGTWTTKPFWVPTYPASVPTSAFRDLVTAMTGLQQGGKSYYAQSRSLRKCQGVDETVTCDIVHPIVWSKPPPETLGALFHASIIIPIRNPATAIPSFHNEKAVKYHGVIGQTPIDNWRQTRDEWFEKKLMDEWKSFILAWKQMNTYSVGMYLQYEKLIHKETGPAVLQRLADQFRRANFTVVPPQDIVCIWHKQQLSKDRDLTTEEYSTEYVPGYTHMQRDLLLRELDSFIKEVSDDNELVSILKEYYEDIETNTPIDKQWENKTVMR